MAIRGLLTGLTLAVLPVLAPVAAGAEEPDAAKAPVDYRDGKSWLCRPGRNNDACAVDLDATVVAADGTMTIEAFSPADDPAVDCFYVYPTASRDELANSDLDPGPGETLVVAWQFARFASVCRPFAPIYRQMTLPALQALMAGMDVGIDRDLAYGDVRDAFADYLEHDNNGRPFVLIGHSQGTDVLKRLIQNEVDGKPVQDRMLSALLIGNNIAVPDGADVGGDFQSVPLCRSADQTGCAVSFMSFRADVPRPADSFFGVVEGDDQQAACTHPGNLAGDTAAGLDAYMPRTSSGTPSAPSAVWAQGAEAVETPFVKVPDLLSGACVTDANGGHYLAVTVHADAGDPRTDTISGDIVVEGQTLDSWGLHLLDVNLAQGDLMALIESQAAAKSAD